MPRKLRFHTDSSPISSGTLSAGDAVAKCTSIAWKPSSRRRKPSGPIAIMVLSPMDESIE